MTPLNANLLDTLLLAAVSCKLPASVVQLCKRLESDEPLDVSAEEWAAFSEWHDMCKAARVYSDILHRLQEVDTRLFHAALFGALGQVAAMPVVGKTRRLPALPTHPLKRKKARLAWRYRHGALAKPAAGEVAEGSEAYKFVMGLAAPTPTYADRLREAFYQSSLLHPLLHPAPDCLAHLLRGDDRLLWHTTPQDRAALDAWLRTCLADYRLAEWHDLLISSVDGLSRSY